MNQRAEVAVVVPVVRSVLLALVLYPVVWLLLLPFRIMGLAVGGVLEIVWAVVTLPARLLGATPHGRAQRQ